MAEESTRRALGRGLAALIGDVETDTAAIDRARGAARKVPLEFLTANPRNPRKTFDGDELDQLAASVREKGIVQPILVRPAPGQPNRFEIIAGERRWRAAQKAGLHEVPVTVQDVSDKEALELAIIENVQRADLNAIEEANGYQQLIDSFGYSQTDLADVIGKSRPHVVNTLRLLKLPAEVQAHVQHGRLSAGHARALVGSDDAVRLAARIVADGLSVRETEALLARPGERPRVSKPGGGKAKDADTVALEKALGDTTGLKVMIDHRANGTGELHIRYLGLDQLDDICRRLQNG
ncbi:MAG: ParB/RepB/Spo0J family partition protein [Bauldia sp.]|nr:ParB/RepB/Spo0J family partition protein [Bauldia sp.]